MGREFELKYAADAAAMAAAEKDYPGGTIFRMETTYYDVPSRALSQKHWTLRRRLENGVSVCTLKTPCPDGGRGEWETECADLMEAVPALISLGAPSELAALTAEGVIPICGARFTRRAVTLEWENAVLELAMDQGVLLGGGQEQPLCEIEVELKQGSDEAAIAFGQLLAARYGLHTEKKSKFRRAKDLAEEN